MAVATTQTQTTDAQPLSPDLQFLRDAGEDVDAFLTDAGIEAPKPDAPAVPATKPAGEGAEQAAEGADATTKAAGEGDDEPGEIVVADDGKVRDAKGRFVPKAAYMRQQDRANTAESELQRLREQLAVANTKLELSTKTPAKAEGDKAPANPFEEPDVDPAENLMGAIAQTQRRQRWQSEHHAKVTQETTARLTEQGVVQAYRDDTSQFAAKQTDYPQAFAHVVRMRAAELIAMGMTDKAAVTKQLQEDEQEIARQALASGRSPAQVFYALAIAKGYQAPQAQQQQQQQTAPAASKPAEKTAAEQVLENVRAGQAAGTTLTGAGGTGAPGLTVDQYLAMSVDEIIKLKSTASGMAQLRAIGAA